MNTTDTVLLQLTGRALFGISTDFDFSSVDWTALYKESSNQALTLLIWDILTDEERATIPKEVYSRWEQTAFLHIMNNENLLYEQKQVLSWLDEANILCVILKGSSSAACYPKPELRIMGDIDLLVKPDQQMDAVKVLQQHGYGEVLEDTHYCHLTIHKGKTVVEVHKDPNGITLAGELEQKIRHFFSDAVDNRKFVDGLPFLQDDKQAIVLLLHKLEHFINNGFGMRQLCDWAVFVHNRLTADFWNKLEPVLADFGLLYFTGIITKACIESIGLPKEDAPWAMEYDAAFCWEIIDNILSDGNFGRKKRTYGGRLFTDPHSSNRIISFFHVLNSACKEKWPICNKHPVLRPVAPFVLLGRYLQMHREGRRSDLHLIKMYKQAEERQKLIKSLKPFIAE